jgi:hypothetical protein
MSRPTVHTALIDAPLIDAPLPDPRLTAALRQVLLAGIALVLVIPAARGQSHWLGAWPLWLVAMPAASLWALHRFPLPRWRAARAAGPVAAAASRPRRRGPQARRRRQYPAASRAFSASARPMSMSSAARQNS